MQDCDRALELISQQIDDAQLDELSRQWLRAHLAQCSACASLAHDLALLHSAMQTPEDAPVPPGFRQNVMDQVRREPMTREDAPAPVRGRVPRPLWQRWAGLAAVLALVAVGGGAYVWQAGAPDMTADPPGTAAMARGADTEVDADTAAYAGVAPANAPLSPDTAKLDGELRMPDETHLEGTVDAGVATFSALPEGDAVPPSSGAMFYAAPGETADITSAGDAGLAAFSTLPEGGSTPPFEGAPATASMYSAAAIPEQTETALAEACADWLVQQGLTQEGGADLSLAIVAVTQDMMLDAPQASRPPQPGDWLVTLSGEGIEEMTLLCDGLTHQVLGQIQQ